MLEEFKQKSNASLSEERLHRFGDVVKKKFKTVTKENFATKKVLGERERNLIDKDI